MRFNGLAVAGLIPCLAHVRGAIHGVGCTPIQVERFASGFRL
jgi:hypothetical protein